jgi:hypothetical protein
MRLMEQIRRHGDKGLKFFLVIFLISVFAGLGVGFFGDMGGGTSAQRLSQNGPPPPPPVDPVQEWALKVNGRPVSNDQFYERVRQIERMYPQDDPEMQLRLYGAMAQAFVGEEVLLGEAAKHKVRVDSKDLADEKQKILDQQQPDASKKQPADNVLGQGSQWLGTQREKHTLFVNYLQRTGITEDKWVAQVTREILQRKAREAVEKGANSAKDVKAKEKRAGADAELAKGTSFAEVAKKYSDAAESAAKGGDMTPAADDWLLPGLLSDEKNESKNDIVLFGTAKGELTPWFEIPAGYQRWLVYDRKALDDEEFAAAKDKIKKGIEDTEGKDHTVTDEELKKYAFKIKARQIQISNTDPEAVTKKVEELNKAAQVEINNPYVLAYQALYDDKLQPPSTVDYDQLVTIAKKSAATDAYDFSPIKAKLAKGNVAPAAGKTDETDVPEDVEKTDEAGADAAAPPAGDEVGAAETAAADAAEETASSDTKPASDTATTSPAEAPVAEDKAPELANPSAPIYALGVGLLELALEGEDVQGSGFGEAVVATVYLKWLKEENDLKTQPVDRDKARAEVETRFEHAVKIDNYNAKLYADRALNLAWLNKPDQAKEQLELAEKYVSDKQTPTLEAIKAAYDKLDMVDKAKAIQERLDKAKSDAFMEQLQQQIQMQQGGGAAGGTSMPITIPPQ